MKLIKIICSNDMDVSISQPWHLATESGISCKGDSLKLGLEPAKVATVYSIKNFITCPNCLVNYKAMKKNKKW